MDVHWFLPTAGDSHGITSGGQAAATVVTERPPDLDHLALVARAAEKLGFTGVLTPTGTFCEDSWLTTAALLAETRTLRFLVAFRPGLISPTLAAQMASTYQRISGGRLLLNVVTGGEPTEQRRFGDWLDHDQRYARTAEFLTVLRGAWSGAPYDFDGEHYRVAGATTRAAPEPVPPVFFGGSSPAALRVAAAHADTYLTWGEPPAAVAAKLDAVRTLAKEHDRTLTYGIRLHVITRDTAAEAWAQARALIDRIPPAAVAAARERFARTESEGQRRMAALTTGDDLEISPNLWAGFGLVRPGAGTALVGSHAEVAERIAEYRALGIGHVILSGQPHLEEAFCFGEGVLPLLNPEEPQA
ncbi:LLM class flavin-dependent oxidoreductase [Couchioplanes caeruleus]|uniref:LLM class flavin-dependent oxidoreductase n=1 Tax=Couchioplanes caeruleus TaxID=56438 RepID=UPI00201C802F|nr:LLM class flavin-dependent oxidoreductase [Couchioplanes caeruleus]UQU66745.1 LLM class flavin-dependent oxidoreductase [Couchioplanes caeruleus]